MDELTQYRVTIENLLMITHAVPVERVRAHVPVELELDTMKGPEDEDFVLVSATCFLNRDLEWAGLELPMLDFHQATFRTYIRHEGEAGVYLLGSFVERGTPHISQRLAMKNAYPGDFDISLSYDPAKRCYGRYYCEILGSGKGDTIVEVSSEGQEPILQTPFESREEMVRFITHRLVGYFPMPDGHMGEMRVEHGLMKPVDADLLAAELGYWEKLGVVWEEEFEQPYSVLIQPCIEMQVHIPRRA